MDPRKVKLENLEKLVIGQLKKEHILEQS